MDVKLLITDDAPANSTQTKSDLWTIHGHEYDLSAFAKRHPGGEIALALGRGRDCTAMFESYHVFSKRHRLVLQTYAVTKEGAVAALNPPKDAFYEALIARARDALEAAGRMPDYKADCARWWWYLTVLCTMIVSWIFFVRGSVVGMFAFPLASFLMGTMGHDGSHFAVSRSPCVNHLCAIAGMWFVAGPPVWYNQHVYAHHSHTNEAGADPDMYHAEWFRVHESIEHVAIHRWQSCRMWTYSLWCLSAVGNAVSVPIESLFTKKISYTTALLKHGDTSIGGTPYYIASVAHSTLYLLMITLPVFTLGIRAGIVRVIAQVVFSGWLYGFFSQINHFNDDAHDSVAKRDANNQPTSWSVRQVESSTNWAMGSVLWNLLSTGLNFQIEHHLFPCINPKHYQIVAPAVQDVCNEFGVHYNCFPTFFDALGATDRFYARLSKA